VSRRCAFYTSAQHRPHFRDRFKGETIMNRKEWRLSDHAARGGQFTCAPDPREPNPRRVWDARPLVLFLVLLALSLFAAAPLLAALS
jgi:hypothetical protein